MGWCWRKMNKINKYSIINMEANQIFQELMKSEDLQTKLGISKEELDAATYEQASDNAKIEVIKDIINGVVNHKADNTVFQGIRKRLS